MALTEKTIEDKIEILGEHRIVQVRTATIIERDGVEISRSYHRHTVTPLDSVSDQSQEVKAVVNAVHTDTVKKAYQAHLESQEIGA